VCVGGRPVQDTIQLHKDEQAHAAGVFVTLPQHPKNPSKPGSDAAKATHTLTVATPVNFGSSVSPTKPVPLVGEHNQEVSRMLNVVISPLKNKAKM
jgi:hypothetical protein